MRVKNKITGLMCAPIALAMLAACASDDELGGTTPEVKGQTLVINATTDAGTTRVDYGKNDDGTQFTAKWNANDNVCIFAGDVSNTATFSVDGGAGTTSATLKGILPSGIKDGTTISGYIKNTKITSSNVETLVENGFGKQVQVDYSNQTGTYQDAMSRCVLFGSTTYSSTTGNNVNMKFDYYTTFLKLTLDFQNAELNNNKVDLYLNGTKVSALSRIHTVPNGNSKPGALQNLTEGTIKVSSANITNGVSVVYIALFPREISEVKLQAFVDNGDVYDFDISGNRKASLKGGKIYDIKRKGTKQETTKLNGAGSAESPYLINNLSDLKFLAKNTTGDNATTYANKYIELKSDIIINGGEWTPIGNNSKKFQGNFNGGGHTISGDIEFTNVAQNEGAGLFGVIGQGAVIKNLKNKLNIKATTSANYVYTGSLVGSALYTFTIQNCSNVGSVESSSQYVGGLIGSVAFGNTTTAVVEACSFKGEVNNNSTIVEKVSTGGLIGVVNANSRTTSTLNVNGCYVDGAVLLKPQKNYCGGIVGNVQNCKSDGMLTVTACWVRNITYPQNQGYVASIVSSAGKDLVYKVNTCWSDVKKQFKVSSVATEEDCKFGDAVKLEDMISSMNTAWSSSAYEFNNDGTIKVKE